MSPFGLRGEMGTTITNTATGESYDLDAFCQRWMACTMTAEDDKLWAEWVNVDSIRTYVLIKIGY